MIQISGLFVRSCTLQDATQKAQVVDQKFEIDVEFVSFAFYCEAAKTTKTKNKRIQVVPL